ncbi:MAG: EMC3/TMCO1 family protein [Candidatus Thalassarchaeaceae archaeon]|jgi:uncharacterized membrane protein (DUF106 family)|nr:EMC3/TMCO1 family protein [Candidatus Thalassarchaeaceae archaeon]|tara:strand:+ start:53 stop:979 length:927 start_codon:yes stop_codon:yes gene_type:complete
MPEDSEDEALPGMGSMMTPLLLLVLMSVLIINPSIRNGLAGGADSILKPLIPFSDQWFVMTVAVLGSSIMIVNTVFRSFFMDPLKQAHLAHRNKQMRKLMNEARLDRDNARLDKIQKLQQRLMPEQMKLQNSMMKPMMFTFVFIIAIFSWMALNVESFRVDYVSLPWNPEWNLLEDKVLFFPAWIATYITTSAPLGRVVDRHIKLARYRRHPLVLSGETLPEPYLSDLQDTSSKSSKAKKSKRSRAGPRKLAGALHQVANVEDEMVGEVGSVAPPKVGTTCPDCDSTEVERAPDGRLRCIICRKVWRR